MRGNIMSEAGWKIADVQNNNGDVFTKQGTQEATLDHLRFKVSWTAYMSLIPKLIARLFFLVAMSMLILWALKFSPFKVGKSMTSLITYAMMGSALAWTIYDFAYLRTMKLIVNREGVWIEQGLLPWSKGFFGARWDAIGEAVYTQNFLSWAFKSYDVKVLHRFTAQQELFMRHVANGHIAAQNINRLLAVRGGIV
jgi:hypothetical protein